MNQKYRRRNTASNTSLKIALFTCIVAAIAVVLLFFDRQYVYYDGQIYSADVTTIDLRGSTDVNVDKLCLMDSLQLIDLRQSALTPEQADKIKERMPECRLLWSVPVARQTFDSNTASLVLDNPSEDDLRMLRYFDSVESITVNNCTLYDAMSEYNLTSPDDVDIVWTVPIGGRLYKSNTVTVKLPEATAEDIRQLQHLPALTSADLNGCTAYEQIVDFAKAHPDCDVSWTVDLAGTAVSSKETELDISGTKITDVDAFEKQLGYLPNLEKLIMCDCGLSNEKLDELNKKYENIKIVWRVYFGKWSLRTDATAFSTQQPEKPTYRLTDKEVTVLKYCTDLEMLDLGHQSLTSVDSFADLTNLKVLILADNRISDISPLYKLTKMEYFEMFINRISDISVVEYMPNLTDVNFCWNRVYDPSPLYTHQHLERVWMCGGGMSGATKREFMAALPDVEFDLYSTYGSTNGSWRHNEHFSKIRDGFRNHNGMNDYHW